MFVDRFRRCGKEKKGMKREKFQPLLLALGLALVMGAAVWMIVWNWNMDRYQEQSESYVNTLREIMPAVKDTVPQERRDNTMAVLSVDEIDFVGIIEMPRYGSELAVCADWGNTARFPRRFFGSIYDGTLQIGATAQKGQYDFYNNISLGDAVLFTDAEGNRYHLQVTGIYSAKSIDQTALNRTESTLAIFIEKPHSFEYLIVFCNS
jgi:hypothetical protein